MSGEQVIMGGGRRAGITPAGAHNEGQRLNGARFTSVMPNGFTYQEKQLPTPGAMNFALETFALAETSPIGAGVRFKDTYMFTSPPLILNGQSMPLTGMGGVYQGTYYSQPLFDPFNNTYGSSIRP